jgi:hypothetical protein
MKMEYGMENSSQFLARMAKDQATLADFWAKEGNDAAATTARNSARDFERRAAVAKEQGR